MKDLARKVKALVDDKTRYTDWLVRLDVKAEMEADLMILLDENGYPPVPRNEVYNEVLVRINLKCVIIQIRQIASNKKQFLALSLLADEQKDMIDLYHKHGGIFVLKMME